MTGGAECVGAEETVLDAARKGHGRRASVAERPGDFPGPLGLPASPPLLQPSTPVAEWEAPTGLDSGDPRCLR